ncbi:bifunctional Protein kinase domain/Protein kinase-like domain superfamily [Babesia duncani]|uniref:Bifunctional Protein kinase domain/Protein kinase-like domain superfamily n=1 Tax=Babesia duncani TaxID=323732 RepID=A0AAD9PKS6_9APIC|nr:bifunctional Protein kinase domain/Protein kinase-like domain superfamily [Babesia duncani]
MPLVANVETIDHGKGPLYFVNSNNKIETLPSLPEYPLKCSSTDPMVRSQKSLEFKEMLYPVLPSSIKVGKKTYLAFCSGISNELDAKYNVQLDEVLSEKVSYCMNHGLRGSDDAVHAANQKGIFNQTYAKDRRQFLFAKQWKRNALNEFLLNHYTRNCSGESYTSSKQQIKNDKRLRDAIAIDANDGQMRDWRFMGTKYFNRLNELLSTYHDYLYNYQKENTRLKHRTSNTSRYFFEILAEAKECERKMYECELFNEEKIYGRRDFISEFQRENQMLKRKYKKLYSLSIACMRRNIDREPAPPNPIVQNDNNQNMQYMYNVQVTENEQGDEYNVNECLNVDTMANPPPRPSATNENPPESASNNNVNRDNYTGDYADESAISRATTIPSEMYNYENRKSATKPHSIEEEIRANTRASVSFVGCNPDTNMQPSAENEKEEITTPTHKVSIVNRDNGEINSQLVSIESWNRKGSTQDECISNPMNSFGGVNKWIYSKMEERGEFDGYHLLLHELESLLFSDGNVILGFSTLPHVLEWLDETDTNRMTVPPSQDHFRDGTMFTTCIYAEIKLMKILQGAIYTLRQRHRQREVYPLILQHILEANNELYELKRKLDSGRCALYKKLKLHWAERNSKWGGFPPLKRGYRLLNMLGKGGFGEVWEVFDPITLTVQAAKLHILSQDMDVVERGNVVMRVKNEIDIHKTCRTHKHIVNMKACFEMGDNMLATILELCDDGDLDHYIKMHAPVPEKLALTWTFQILEGLHYMKTLPEGRVHHCDLKPGNILRHRGDIKLADFGLSKMAPRDSENVLWGGGGTIWYQPPECLLANVRHNHRIVLTDKIDIWAVGCILYEMLYNCRPFGNIVCKGSLSERIYQETILGPRFPASYKVSDECKELILRFLAFEPKDRPSIEEAMAFPIFLADI